MTVLDHEAPPFQAFQSLLADARAEVAKVVVGHDEAVELLVSAAVAGGHVLLEGPPGVAKTTLAGALARVLGCAFARLQFTPDTRPDHITGTTVYKMGEPVFAPGAIFTNIVLADEINRTPPRTQAALLEAMQEHQVTVDGKVHFLPTPFMVVATQNPYEQEGVYVLPESQLDRFLFKVNLSYGSAEQEIDVLGLPHRGLAPDFMGEVRPILGPVELDRAQRELDGTELPAAVARYVVAIIRRTREAPGVRLGASPRAAVHLAAAAKARARLNGRDAVVAEDVAAIAPDVLRHRLIMAGGGDRVEAMRAVLESVPPPP